MHDVAWSSRLSVDSQQVQSGSMYELIPIALGALLGYALRGLPRKHAAWIGAPFALAGGLAASTLSGEIEQSLGFAAWDALQALLVAAATYLLAARLAGRREGRRRRPTSG